jgi:two-component system KDP operon response regulator KdpE
MAQTPILLVEDNPLDALLLTEQLGDRYHFRRAVSLADAVREIQAAPPACAIVDLTLPDARGPDVIAALRAVAPAVPLIAHSGLDAALVAAGALSAGAQSYVTKASTPGELSAALAAALA